MIRFSPSRVALGYIALGIVALALFAIPLWSGYRANLGTFRAYVPGAEMQRLVDIFHRDGAHAVAEAMESYLPSLPRDEVIVFVDPDKRRLAGNLPAWPAEVPEVPGTYGLVIGLGGEESMRVVVSHQSLPGGYRLLMGRESVRFQSLVERFWYGIAGAMAIVLVLGAVLAWRSRRALLSEVNEISRAASAIVDGDLSRRLPVRGGSGELDALAQTVNGMLEQLHGALQKQTAYLDQLFDLAPDAVVLTELRPPRILRVNHEFTRMFGYTSEEAVGRSLRELIAPGELQAEYAKNAAAIAAGERVDVEVVRQRKDGTRIHVHFTSAAIKTDDGKGVAYLVYRDITERKRFEEELRSRQEMVAVAQKAARAVAFDWRAGAHERQNRWPPELEAMYGLAPGTWAGSFRPFGLVRQDWKKLVHPDDWATVTEAIKHAYRTGDVAIEYRVVHPDGSVHWLQSKGRMFVDAETRPVRMVGLIQDVTQLRQAEEELRKMERQLRQAHQLEAMGTLAGGIAHDFNNILGAILGYGEMALRDAPKGSRLHRDLDSIMSAGERGRALVERVLAFSRSSVGERVAVHVEKVVREALDLLSAKLPPNVTLHAKLRARGAAMSGDPTQVHQVLMNLVTNGVQAMPSGGTLRVSLDAVRLDAQRIATTRTIPAGDYIVLTVADEGCGIPAEIFDRIFDPFFTTKDVGVGTGLGLSLVHGIVSEVGGAVDVKTAPGAGSTFTVYLPRSGDASDSLQKEELDMPRGDGQRVLVVDDEEPLVRLATRTLEELGYVATGFTSSSAALAAFRADPQRFDAVITDERMPGMSGSALIREVRGIRGSIPVVLMSGYAAGALSARESTMLDGLGVLPRVPLAVGANEVLTKPLSARELAGSLARVLRPM